jgi:hypothetical protein
MVKSNVFYVKLYDTGTQAVKHLRGYPCPRLRIPQ